MPLRREEVRAALSAFPLRREEVRAGQSAFPLRRGKLRAGRSSFPLRREEVRAGRSAFALRREEVRAARSALGRPPRGPAISGSPWLETAAPFRVNFRQIRGPGVSEAKIQSDRPEGRHDGSEVVISQKTTQDKRKAQTRCESALYAFIAAYSVLFVPQEGKCCPNNPVRLR